MNNPIEDAPCISPEDMAIEVLYGTDEHLISLDEARDLGVAVDDMDVEFGDFSEWED